ncbi:MAG: AbrB family transcriptional regulator [Betaproteobacteria bacterium]|nr:AbrB family transcriptional regulator [Betaproteobacteria bacterium]
MANTRNILLGLLVSASGGALCAWIKTPLPWMIGPLVGMAIFNFSGARLTAPPLGREAGQLLIAVTLGLYFTPAVAREVWGSASVLLAAAFGAILIGFAASRVLARFAKIDPATAFFASVPGGATEMAILGERFDAAVDKVAVAHSLRILIVVCTIPVLLTLADVHGGDIYRPVLVLFSWKGLLALFGVAAVGGVIFSNIGFPNPWMMGPLIATIAITASGTELSAMSGLLTNVGQVLLGCALGARFSRSFLSDAPRFVAAVVGCIVLMMLMSTAMAFGLAKAADIFFPSMVLAAAPGGIAEMSITARTLQLGVALVTAAHVTRVLVIVSSTLPVYRLLTRLSSGR